MKTLKFERENVDISKLSDWQQEKKFAHIQAWFNQNQARDEMIYKDAASNQFVLIRDYFYEANFDMEVVSTHRSKSIHLGVYRIFSEDIEFIIRGNFHNWMITVNSKEDIEIPQYFIDTYHMGINQINPVYCEGFDDSWVLEGYSTNKKEFTLEINYSNEPFHILFYLIRQQLTK